MFKSKKLFKLKKVQIPKNSRKNQTSKLENKLKPAKTQISEKPGEKCKNKLKT
jgi:hypothetical protein